MLRPERLFTAQARPVLAEANARLDDQNPVTLTVADFKILIAQTQMKEGKLGFDFKDGGNTISRPGPGMKRDADGKWSITL